MHEVRRELEWFSHSYLCIKTISKLLPGSMFKNLFLRPWPTRLSQTQCLPDLMSPGPSSKFQSFHCQTWVCTCQATQSKQPLSADRRARDLRLHPRAANRHLGQEPGENNSGKLRDKVTEKGIGVQSHDELAQISTLANACGASPKTCASVLDPICSQENRAPCGYCG